MKNWALKPPAGRIVVADTETDGLPALPNVPIADRYSTLHSLSVRDIQSKEHWTWGPISVPAWEALIEQLRQHPGCFDTETQTVTVEDMVGCNYQGIVEEGVQFLQDECGTFIGHNFLLYDAIEAISTLCPGVVDWSEKLILDTLIMAKMVWPADALMIPDMKRFRASKLPAKYIKRQSLGAWGYRLGNYKGEFGYDAKGKPIPGVWKTWTPAMHVYMHQDTNVNVDLWGLIEKRIGWDEAKEGSYQWPALCFWIEHEVAKILHEQERHGVWYDKDASDKLVAQLMNLQAELSAKLVDIFGSWWAPKDNPVKGRTPSKDRTVKLKGFPDVTIKRYGKNGQELKPYVGPPKEHYFAGAPYVRLEYTTFNPNSRRHLADRLQRVFGWVPTVFTPTGEPMVDEGSIKNIPDGVISPHQRQVIMDYFVVTKTLGMVAEGKKSWVSFYNEETHCIHGRVDPLGTVTNRGAHFNPNLGQVMSVKVKETKDEHGKVISKEPIRGLAGGFGVEARSLFAAGPGREQSGTDCSSLEFICLGHDLWRYDDGAFSRRACNPEGDLHAENAQLTGLNRADTKTVGYAYLYGAGAPHVGELVGLSDADDPQSLAASRQVESRLKWMKKVLGREYQEPNELQKALIGKGYQVIGAFEAGITGVKELKLALKDFAEENGYILALDGRKLHMRKAHAALNTRLQGNGAVICKLWMILLNKKLQESGLKLYLDYNQVLWVHDELQFAHRPGLGELFRKLSDEAVKEAGTMLGLRGTLRTETKIGANWAECH